MRLKSCAKGGPAKVLRAVWSSLAHGFRARVLLASTLIVEGPPWTPKPVWSIPLIGFLLLQLLRPLGLCAVRSLAELLHGWFSDEPVLGSNLLSWHCLGVPSHPHGDKDLSKELSSRLFFTLLSCKGSDVMIQMSQRFRTSIAAHLGTWRTVCGFSWSDHEKDYINRLELRAVYTALRWSALRRKEVRCHFLHLTDSMVCLHVLNHGRSSSRKKQSLMYRVSSLLLAAGLQPYEAYVSTCTNPADRPSRRLRVKRKWSK